MKDKNQELDAKEMQKLARMARLSENVGLTVDQKETVKNFVMRGLGRQIHDHLEQVGETMPFRPEAAADGASLPSLSSAHPSSQVEVSPSQEEVSPSQEEVSTPQEIVSRESEEPVPHELQSAEEVELKLRELVELSVRWPQLQPWAQRLYHLCHTPKMAARLIELAFIHGNTLDTIVALKLFDGHDREVYFSIHSAVRSHIVVAMWIERRFDWICPVLIGFRQQSEMTPVERLLVFYQLTEIDEAAAYRYFTSFRTEMMKVAVQNGRTLGLSPDSFFLKVGRLAANLGLEHEARDLLDHIDTASTEYQQALRILLHPRVVRNATYTRYLDIIAAIESQSERLEKLEEFFGNTRQLGVFHDRNRPALNQICQEIHRYFESTPETIKRISEIICANRDLVTVLPNLFDFFLPFALEFRTQEIEVAVWHSPMMIIPKNQNENLLKGLAQIHYYVMRGPSSERELWSGRQRILNAESAHPSWSQVHMATLRRVGKVPGLFEAERKQMLLQLKVAAEFDAVTAYDVEQYLHSRNDPPRFVLDAILKMPILKTHTDLVYKAIFRKCEKTHLVNSDLARLWQIVSSRRMHDLGWRMASVLHARGALHPTIQAAWQICGENRKDYPKQPLNLALAKVAMAGFSQREASLGHALLTIGPCLNEIFHLVNPLAGEIQYKRCDEVTSTYLDSQTWIARRKKKFGRLPIESKWTNPSFVKVAPENSWSYLVLGLSNRLGMGSFGWEMSQLRTTIETLVPRVTSGQRVKHSAKVAKWLKQLTPEQRVAWHDLVTLSREFSDEEGQRIMGRLVCRLATIMYQNHYQALKSLQAMRAPCELIWDLELFIISDAYSKLRKKLMTFNRVPVALAHATISPVQ